ncbi:MAG: hypothetical protein WA869_17655, partial [Alloacidobacterium sp.]
MSDLAVASAAFRSRDVQPARSGGNHDLANLCSSLAQRLVALPHRTAPASAIGVVRLNDRDPAEVDLSFLGKDHGQGGEDSLAHLGFVESELG